MSTNRQCITKWVQTDILLYKNLKSQKRCRLNNGYMVKMSLQRQSRVHI